MNETAAAFNGTRVLLRGLGVGVRIGREYTLFDRFEPTDSLQPLSGVASAYSRRDSGSWDTESRSKRTTGVQGGRWRRC